MSTPVAPPPLPKKTIKIGNNGDITSHHLPLSSLENRSKFCAALEGVAKTLGIDTDLQTPVAILDNMYPMSSDADFLSMKSDSKISGPISVVFLKEDEILQFKDFYEDFGDDTRAALKQGKPETVTKILSSLMMAQPPRAPARE